MSARNLPSAAEIRLLLELAEKRELLLERASFNSKELAKTETEMSQLLERLFNGQGPPGSRG
jgi:hypothetical protein